ncbi:MAG: hypothetical protein R2793_09095 [Flavobacteriaceae bacterium]
MKNSTLIQTSLKTQLGSLLMVSISLALIYVCYASIQFTWDYLAHQVSLEMDRWVSQPITSLY